MIKNEDRFFNYSVGRMQSGDDRYNGEASSSVVSGHLGILKVLLENLKLSTSEFFTISNNNGELFNYYIKINNNRYLNIKLRQDDTSKCFINLINFEINGRNSVDSAGELEFDLTQSLTSSEIQDSFKIGIHFIENGTYDANPVDRFTFNHGTRGSRFNKRR